MDSKTNSYNVTFKFSEPLLNNQSDVLSNSTDLLEAFKLKEHEQYLEYKPIACALGVLIFISNITVVVSSGLILKKGQQTKSTYLLLGNVSLADTIIGISMIIGVVVENPINSSPLCIIQIGMLVCPAMVSIFSVALIAVDRYIYILHGLYYQRWVNTTKVRICIIFIWIIGITLGFLPITGWVNQELNSKCYYVALFPKQLILLNSILSIVPIIVVAVLYTIILIRALRKVKEINASVKPSRSNSKPVLRIYRGNGHKNQNTQSVKRPRTKTQEIKRSSSFHARNSAETEKQRVFNLRTKSKSNDELNIENKVSITKNEIIIYNPNKYDSGNSLCSTDISVIEESSFTINQEFDNKVDKNDKKIKNASKPKIKDATKWRAIIIVMLTTGSFVFTWMPFFITVIFYALCEDKLINQNCYNLRIMLGGPIAALAFLNSVLNPLIYVWWHKGFQRNVKLYLNRYVYIFCQKSK
ncbi:5-hydroxytryptamine receptor 1A-alpha-like [Zerene cesonia]|uniref:5-hydroxytryptamine receptor 1A-alpha-like n=1 Tax=Zerene cesonia TaxID=33412 RepID=UPI0018E57E20|nr:5-hydroxytryptamine receptor 1A-alpha-like [Zerene cesonia]